MDNTCNQTIRLFDSHPEPVFESDTGQIRVCLMHCPGEEMETIDPRKRINSVESYGDLEKDRYSQSVSVPDRDEFRAQHDGLVRDSL